MEKKIVFFDIDGTLVLPHHKPSPKVKEAIQKLRANGHLAFICTGRNRCMLEKELEDIGFDGIICSAGSFLEIDNKVIEKTYINHEKVLEIMSIFNQNNIAYVLEGTYNSFADENMVELFVNSTDQSFNNSELERIHKEVEEGMNRRNIKEFLQNPKPIHKISFIAENYDDLKHPKEALGAEYNFVIHDIFSKNSVNGEIIDKEKTKGIAVKKVLEILELSQQQTIAFGDSMNDYEMLQAVAYGVAMIDGAKELKEIANAICPGVKDDGVYQELKKLKLI